SASLQHHIRFFMDLRGNRRRDSALAVCAQRCGISSRRRSKPGAPGSIIASFTRGNQAMRILVVNVNTTASMTEAIGQQAQAVANPDTEIVPLTPAFGAESVEGNYESYVAAVSVMETIRAYDGNYDAIIQAGYGEHGREGLQELFAVPIVDITEAAAASAMFLGHKYSVVTTLDRTVPLIEDRLRLAGLFERCASVRSSGLAVLDLEKDPDAAIE